MNLPDDTQRLTVIGATGSGKTQAAMWHLSEKNYDEKPWIIYDFKFEAMINEVEGLQHISLIAPIPERPGLYVVHPHPTDDALISEHMERIRETEDVGVFVDEAHMIGINNGGFRGLLTQGRSKHIPMIVCQQRPVWVDRYVFSESDFYQIFRIQNIKDLATIKGSVPRKIDKRLPKYHSYYYDVGEDAMVVMKPVPDREAILDTFYTKLRRLKKVV
jgi:hypothetical protein